MAKTPSKVTSFYGATRKEYMHQLKKKRRLIENSKSHSLRHTTSYQYNSFFGERIVWKWFPRQQDAFQYCNSTREKYLTLFTYEKNDSKRKFLVTSRQQFWNRYLKMRSSERHFYEVICESNPCRLYFDIEFEKSKNPSLGNGTTVLETFIQLICCCLYLRFKIKASRENLVDLDSSTENKFSRHLIFHLQDNALFTNNIECGCFVRSICSSLSDYLSTGISNYYFPGDSCDGCVASMPSIENLREIMVNNDQGKTFLCDLSVYTKNRNFRLYLSSKFSKNVPLVIASENAFCFKNKLTNIERQLYKLQNKKFDKEFRQFFDTLVCPDLVGNIRMLTSTGGTVSLKSNITNPVCCEERRVDGCKISPYPDLDRFVLQQAAVHCLNGSIRRWIHYEQRHMIIYDLDNNRWCGNIQRQHKSNHIYYVADLRAKVIYQKCHDPNCENFKSSEIPIPVEVLPFADDDLIEQFDVSIDDNLNKMFDEEFLPDTSLLAKTDACQYSKSNLPFKKNNHLSSREHQRAGSGINDGSININSKEILELFEEEFTIDVHHLEN